MGRVALDMGKKNSILALAEAGLSQREIGRQLGINHSIVSRFLKKIKETGDMGRRPSQGRGRKTTPRIDRVIIREALRDRAANASIILNRIRFHDVVPLTTQTIRNRLHGAGLKSRRRRRVPMLSAVHRYARLQYSRFYCKWSRRQWGRVLFTDESRFNLWGNDGRVQVWRRSGERNLPECVDSRPAFYRGSVMVWGGISMSGRTDLVVITPQALNARRYIDEVLRPHVLPRAENGGFILMQDNARPHTAKITRDFLQDNRIPVLKHPAMSPDLNPIEHVWDMVGRRLRKRFPHITNVHQLAGALREVWKSIPQSKIRRCINMRARLESVLKARGGNTPY